MQQPFPSGQPRYTTVIRLEGGGHEGVGEVVLYNADDQLALYAWEHTIPVAGEFTLEAFSQHLNDIKLSPTPPKAQAEYRRWGFEGAALDLALHQAGVSLAEVVGRTPRSVRFVASMGLGDPPSLDRIRAVLDRNPDARFKLDPVRTWTDEFARALADAAGVDVMDFKGHYVGEWVDNTPDPALYGRILRVFPDAWIEDPALTAETERVLREHRERVTWDAVIHSVDDIRARREGLRCVNMKPSRFGTCQRLFDAYDYCEAEGLLMYGGGQFELGPGRGQIQYLASLYHADAPNDVAPIGYNENALPDTLPPSPLSPSPAPTGFRWGNPAPL